MNQNEPTAELKDLAGRLLAFETDHPPVDPSLQAMANAPPSFRICEKLRRPLSTLAGSAGFKALLARALSVAKSQQNSLHLVQVNDNGTLEGMDQIPANEATQAGVALVAQLLGLLVTFIGEFLILRMVNELWTDLPEATLREARPHD